MLSHDPVRIRLREALEHSPAGRFLRHARAAWADAWARARMPTKTEIRGLEQRGNTCDDWFSLRLLGAGSLAHIRDCRFEGHNVLRLGDHPSQGPALRASVIRDCMLGACTVESVALLERVIVEAGATLRHLAVCAGRADSRFCLGLAVHPGAETGARRVFLADRLRLDDCAAMAALPPAEQDALAHEWTSRLKHCVSDYAFVGEGARLEHVRFVEDCHVGAGAVIRGAAAVRRCILAAQEAGAAVFIGDNVIAEDCVLEAGVRLDSAAQARRALFLEHAGAEQGGHVADAVIGPNTHIAKGEITASLVGPFVGFHHQALLIGALWPEGRGNVGYGANVGSNHTGRKPDQELRPGEGTFFGLGCAIKFPADFSAAPYSLFATGVTTPPQKIAFPFSLIAPGGPHLAPPGTPHAAAGRNEIIPAWMWSENAYALIRNAYKYADRNKATHHPVPKHTPPAGSPLAGTFLAADLFGPRVVAHVTHALAALAALPDAPPAVLTGRDLPAVGENVLHGRRVAAACAAYRNYLAFAFFRALLWAPEGDSLTRPPGGTYGTYSTYGTYGNHGPDGQGGQDDPEGAHGSYDPDGLMARPDEALRIFRELGEKVEASLRKDTARGSRVFADYADFHPEAAKDPVCARLKADLEALTPVLAARLGALGTLPT